MLVVVLFEDFDGMIGDSDRAIVVGARLDGSKFLVVEVVNLRIEETALVLQQVILTLLLMILLLELLMLLLLH